MIGVIKGGFNQTQPQPLVKILEYQITVQCFNFIESYSLRNIPLLMATGK